MSRFPSPPTSRFLAAGALVAMGLVSLAMGCSPAQQQPAADPGSQTPTFGANDMPPGTKVSVARQGQWYPATIVQPLGEGRFLIHYENTGNEWNEVVGPDRLKSLGGGPGGSPFGTTGPAHDYKPGEKVLVTYQNRVLLADVVMQASADTWRVHYDGYGPEAGETVGPDRIKRPFAGPSGHANGESVVVEVNGKPLPAKILAASAADRWVVRFDEYGPQYDQEVGVDRIKAAPPAAAAPPPSPAPTAEPAKAPEPPAPAKPEKPEKPEKKAEKPKPPADTAPAVPAGPPSAGDNVMVSLRGAWFPATVTGPGASGAFKVKFATGGEEEVAADRLVRDGGVAKGLHYNVSQPVLVEFKAVWLPGKVIKVEGKSEYKIRFEGQGPESDEVVNTKRLRPR